MFRHHGVRHVLLATALSLVTTLAAVVVLDAPAQAATSATYVCGGVKHGSGWQTYSSGGYVGNGCGAQIDWHATPFPEDDGVNVYWYFPAMVAGRTYSQIDLWIYIPSAKSYADASVKIEAYCGTVNLFTKYGVGNTYIGINEAGVSGWVYLLKGTSFYSASGCTPYLKAYQFGTGSTRMGFDAALMDAAW